MKVILKKVRIAFPELFHAKAFSNGEGKPAFSASFIFPRDHEGIKSLNAAILEAAKVRWASKAEAVLKSLKSADKLCIHDGDAKTEYQGFEGNLYLTARSPTRPAVRDLDGKTPLVEEDGKPYAGCYVNAIVDVWAQDNGFGKRVNASLVGVQFVADGDRFSGGAVAEDTDFEELGGDDEGFDEEESFV